MFLFLIIGNVLTRYDRRNEFLVKDQFNQNVNQVLNFNLPVNDSFNNITINTDAELVGLINELHIQFVNQLNINQETDNNTRERRFIVLRMILPEIRETTEGEINNQDSTDEITFESN